MDKKVLIITYYWPPSGGSGVQRWLKFVKYLPSFGWEPHVFTPENPSFPVKDMSLEGDVPVEAEVIRFPIWEPYEAFSRLSGLLGQKGGASVVVPAKKKSFFQRVSTWLRGNVFVPDPRVFWVKPSAAFLADYIRDNNIRLIVTTGPPHSMHLIGLKLKKRFPALRWIVDFRDPWTDWGMWDSLMVTKAVRRIHKRLEKRVLARADEIVTVTPFYVRRFEHLSGGREIRLLTNGFDEDDFATVTRTRSGKFIIRHVGLINDRCNPRPFMNALKAEMEFNPKFADSVTVEFIGEVHPEFRQFVLDVPELKHVTVLTGNIPHDDLLKIYGSSSLLLLVLTGYKDAEGFLPGKVFEYLATGIPVLGVGPVEGDSANLLTQTGAGVMFADDDAEGIRDALRRHFNDWESGEIEQTTTRGRNLYSRRHITGELVKLLQERLDS